MIAQHPKQPGGCTGRGFMPGQSGNPAGRPKGRSLTRLLRDALDRDDGALAEMVVDAIIKGAKRGDFRFIKMILDRVDGPVVPNTAPQHPPEGGAAELSQADLDRIVASLAAIQSAC